MVTVEADGTVVDEWSTLVKMRWPLQRVGPDPRARHHPLHAEGCAAARRRAGRVRRTARTARSSPPTTPSSTAASSNGRHAGGRSTTRSARASSTRCARCACRAGSTPIGSGRTAWATCASTTASRSTVRTTRSATPRPPRRSCRACSTSCDITEVDELEPFYRSLRARARRRPAVSRSRRASAGPAPPPRPRRVAGSTSTAFGPSRISSRCSHRSVRHREADLDPARPASSSSVTSSTGYSSVIQRACGREAEHRPRARRRR